MIFILMHSEGHTIQKVYLPAYAGPVLLHISSVVSFSDQGTETCARGSALVWCG